MDIQKYIEGLSKGKKDNLSVGNVKYFMNKLGNPQAKLKFIHVTGTNGKGSVVEMLNNILMKNNYKVGKFISPHLIKYNERISVNNINIKDEELEKIYEELEPIIKTYQKEMTFFDFTTITALLYFYKKKVDIVVMEVGLGGLYDSTNVINPIISIINLIGIDHTNILGKTLKEIAIQKAGIIKENSNTVYVSQEKVIDDIIVQKCKEKNNKLYLIDTSKITNLRYEKDYEIFNYKQYKNIEINLKGKKQIQNAIISLECCEILEENGFEFTEKKIREGLKTVVHKGRFEVIHKNPTIIFDGGHNAQAIENLKDTIDIYYKNAKKIYVMSILKSKDYKTILEELIEDGNIYIFTNGNDKNRYADSHLMYEYSKKLNANIEMYEMDLKEAIQFCKEKVDYVSFIIGSFYVYNDVKKILCNCSD